MPDFEVETRIHTTKSSTSSYQEPGEANYIYLRRLLRCTHDGVQLYKAVGTSVVDIPSRSFVQHMNTWYKNNPYAPSMMHRRYDYYCRYYRGRASLPPITSSIAALFLPSCQVPNTHADITPLSTASFTYFQRRLCRREGLFRT